MSIAPGLTLEQDPNDVLTYQFEWSAFLGVALITSSTFLLSGGDGLLVKSNEAIATGDQATQLQLSGGTVRKTYKITNHIVTNETPPQEKDESFYLTITNQ